MLKTESMPYELWSKCYALVKESDKIHRNICAEQKDGRWWRLPKERRIQRIEKAVNLGKEAEEIKTKWEENNV